MMHLPTRRYRPRTLILTYLKNLVPYAILLALVTLDHLHFIQTVPLELREILRNTE